VVVDDGLPKRSDFADLGAGRIKLERAVQRASSSTTTNGQALAYVYFEEEPGRRAPAKLLTRARRIAANIAKLPDGHQLARGTLCARCARSRPLSIKLRVGVLDSPRRQEAARRNRLSIAPGWPRAAPTEAAGAFSDRRAGPFAMARTRARTYAFDRVIAPPSLFYPLLSRLPLWSVPPLFSHIVVRNERLVLCTRLDA
jgi:hypothetical protein